MLTIKLKYRVSRILNIYLFQFFFFCFFKTNANVYLLFLIFFFFFQRNLRAFLAESLSNVDILANRQFYVKMLSLFSTMSTLYLITLVYERLH